MVAILSQPQWVKWMYSSAHGGAMVVKRTLNVSLNKVMAPQVPSSQQLQVITFKINQSKITYVDAYFRGEIYEFTPIDFSYISHTYIQVGITPDAIVPMIKGHYSKRSQSEILHVNTYFSAENLWVHTCQHDVVITWEQFLHYWPFAKGICYRLLLDSPYKDQRCRLWCFLWYQPE